MELTACDRRADGGVIVRLTVPRYNTASSMDPDGVVCGSGDQCVADGRDADHRSTSARRQPTARAVSRTEAGNSLAAINL
jgi:hypothetical protein